MILEPKKQKALVSLGSWENLLACSLMAPVSLVSWDNVNTEVFSANQTSWSLIPIAREHLTWTLISTETLFFSVVPLSTWMKFGRGFFKEPFCFFGLFLHKNFSQRNLVLRVKLWRAWAFQETASEIWSLWWRRQDGIQWDLIIQDPVGQDEVIQDSVTLDPVGFNMTDPQWRTRLRFFCFRTVQQSWLPNGRI